MAWVNLCSFSDFERFLPSDRSGMIRTCFDLLQVCLGHIFFVRKTFLKLERGGTKGRGGQKRATGKILPN